MTSLVASSCSISSLWQLSESQTLFNKTTISPLIINKASQSGASRSAERLFFSAETLKRDNELNMSVKTADTLSAKVQLNETSKD